MPRKKDPPPPASEAGTPTVSNAAAINSAAQAQQDGALDGIDNYELPKSLVTRIARSAIPENMKLQKDTVFALLKGSTVFINYLAATAHDIAASRQHKSVSASDVLKALEQIQFGDVVEGLTRELNTYRENAKTSKKGGGRASNSKGKGKEKEANKAVAAAPEEDAVDMDGDADMRGPTEGDGEDELVDELEEQEQDELEDDVAEGGEPEGGGEGGEESEQDELVDEMAVDDEEIRGDARSRLGERTEARA